MCALDSRTRASDELSRLAPVLREHCVTLYDDNLCAVFVIGSYARGTVRPESDLDLLIVVDESDVPRRKRSIEFGEPAGYDGPEISPIVYTRREFLSMPSFLLTLLDAHEVMYSRESGSPTNEAEALVGAVRAWAQEHGITRVPHKGGYYWRGLPT